MSGYKDETHVATVGGITTTMAYDDSQDRLLIKNSADVQANLDMLKAIRNDDLGRGEHMHFVGSIPMHMLQELTTIWKANDQDPKVELKKWLNDPDHKYFRASETRI